MSDSVAVKKLEVIDTIKEGVSIGIKNIGPILVNSLLYVLTVWIPYLNVGTTIGLSVGIVSKASKGEMISFTEIFNAKYRKYMGEFFLTSGLMSMGIVAGIAFGIIPGIVIALAWSFALLLVIDKGKNPTEALTVSNNCTYGNKWRMVGVYFLAGLALGIIGYIIFLLLGIPVLGIIILIAYFVFFISVLIGLQASLYKRLTENV